MKFLEINNHYIYHISKGDKILCYNNINGNIAYVKDFSLLDESFFDEPNDTDINFDEVNYEQLYLAVSESCNFRCKYCRQQKSHVLANMSLDEIKYAIDTFLSVSKSPKSVVFFGGEPLLNFEGIRYAIEYIRTLNPNISFSMVINGSLCKPEIASYFAQNNVEVIVSLDGPKEIHNASRLNLNGKSTYQEALKGYLNLKEAGCVTGITTVIGPHNENQFDELINWAIELAPNSLGFCLPHGDKSNYAMGLTSFEKVHKEMLRAFNIFHKKGIYLVQIEQKLKAFILGCSIPFECKACGKRLVACKGAKFGICEGAITKSEYFFSDVHKLKSCVKEYKKTSPYYIQSCRSCIAYRICGGSCVYDKITRFGRPDVPDDCRCGLNVMIAEWAMNFIINNIERFNVKKQLSLSDRNILMQIFTQNEN